MIRPKDLIDLTLTGRTREAMTYAALTVLLGEVRIAHERACNMSAKECSAERMLALRDLVEDLTIIRERGF